MPLIADVLDRNRRKLLVGMLVRSDLDRAIVLATGDEPPSPMAVPSGLKFFNLAHASEVGSQQVGRTCLRHALPGSATGTLRLDIHCVPVYA